MAKIENRQKDKQQITKCKMENQRLKNENPHKNMGYHRLQLSSYKITLKITPVCIVHGLKLNGVSEMLTIKGSVDT